MNLVAVVAGSVVVLGALGALGAITVAVFRILQRSEGGAGGAKTAELAAEVAALRTRVEGLPSLWESERARAEEASELAKQRNSRARAALSTARRLDAEREGELEDDDEPDEGDVLRELDARAGPEQGVLPMRDRVAASAGDSPADELTQRALAVGWSPWL